MWIKLRKKQKQELEREFCQCSLETLLVWWCRLKAGVEVHLFDGIVDSNVKYQQNRIELQTENIYCFYTFRFHRWRCRRRRCCCRHCRLSIALLDVNHTAALHHTIETRRMEKMPNSSKKFLLCFGLFLMIATPSVYGHLNLFLNQHEVMRLLGEWQFEQFSYFLCFFLTQPFWFILNFIERYSWHKHKKCR